MSYDVTQEIDDPGYRYLVTHYEIWRVLDGKKAPWYSQAQTQREAIGVAQEVASKSGLTVKNVSWRQTIPANPEDAVYLCEITRDMARKGQPRVFS